MSPTHAGGILPSSSFFHPGRPTRQPQYSPQPSLAEHIDDDALAALSTDPLDDTIHVPLKAIKPSKEPLLPVQGSQSTQNRIRTSFDRVFGIGDEEHSEQRQFSPQQPSSSSYFASSPRPILPCHSISPSIQSPISSHSPSPPPSFIATPPQPSAAQPYPLARTPVLQPGTAAHLRRFQLHPSRNRFFFRGLLLTGGDSPWAFLASFSLALLLSAVWAGSTAVFWWCQAHSTKALVILGAYLTVLVLTTMLTTATTDPGILPRGLDPEPPYPATSPSDGGVRAPLPRDLRVRSQVVRVKYCGTCKIYRPPRSSHCKMCDNCVDDCDHHCQWVNNCIGRRNYTAFFALISFATITLVLMIVTSSLHIYLLSRQSHSFRRALDDTKGIGSAIVFSISVIILWPIAALFAYHFRLLMLNSTTIEQIRNQAHKTIDPTAEKPQNPYSHGTRRRNIAAVLCRPGGFSWLNATAIATDDRRAINPGAGGIDADIAQRH